MDWARGCAARPSFDCASHVDVEETRKGAPSDYVLTRDEAASGG